MYIHQHTITQAIEENNVSSYIFSLHILMDLGHTTELFEKTAQMIITYMEEVHTGQRPVTYFHDPDTLRSLMDFTIEDTGLEIDEVITTMQQVAHYSVANQHPRFFSALRGGADIYGIMGEWLTAVMGTTMYTYEVAPLFTLMEEYIF